MAGALLDVLDVGKGLGSEHGKPSISAMRPVGRKGKCGSLGPNTHPWASGSERIPVAGDRHPNEQMQAWANPEWAN